MNECFESVVTKNQWSIQWVLVLYFLQAFLSPALCWHYVFQCHLKTWQKQEVIWISHFKMSRRSFLQRANDKFAARNYKRVALRNFHSFQIVIDLYSTDTGPLAQLENADQGVTFLVPFSCIGALSLETFLIHEPIQISFKHCKCSCLYPPPIWGTNLSLLSLLNLSPFTLNICCLYLDYSILRKRLWPLSVPLSASML